MKWKPRKLYYATALAKSAGKSYPCSKFRRHQDIFRGNKNETNISETDYNGDIYTKVPL